MFRFIFVLLRRVLIVILVCCLAYFTVFYLFPYFDRRLPWTIAVALTYLSLAYLIIPWSIRIFRIFDKPNHIPTCTTTVDGWAAEPVNMAILAKDKRTFVRIMKNAGWYVADDITIKSSIRAAWAWVLKRPYPEAPFSRQYLFGRRQDIGFEIPVGGSPRRRHHVRFWRVTHESLMRPSLHEHQTFWQKLFIRVWQKEQALWVGAGTYDSFPIAVSWQNGQFRHKIHPDADLERDFLLKTLKQAGLLQRVHDIRSGEPYVGRAQHIGGKIISDGRVKLCEVRFL